MLDSALTTQITLFLSLHLQVFPAITLLYMAVTGSNHGIDSQTFMICTKYVNPFGGPICRCGLEPALVLEPRSLSGAEQGLIQLRTVIWVGQKEINCVSFTLTTCGRSGTQSFNGFVILSIFISCNAYTCSSHSFLRYLLASMALPKLLTALLFVLALASIDPSACQQVVKGKVSCLDCPRHSSLAGVKVLVKCDKVKKLAMATTGEDGVFEVELPSDTTPRAPTSKCDAKLFGGPSQIYASNKNIKSSVVKARDSSSYTISSPLAFFTTCSAGAKCKDKNVFGSSKTIDLPIPPEWGLAPTSYYVPFFPIIGIP